MSPLTVTVFESDHNPALHPSTPDFSSRLAGHPSAQYLQSLMDFDPQALQEQLEADPKVYISLLNTIARAAK